MEILTKDHSDGKQKESSAMKVIKFKAEPVVEYSLYFIGIIAILIGVVIAIKNAFKKDRLNYDERTSRIRIQVSEAIALGLTFILGAEVIKIFRIPTLFQLIKVSTLVILRQLITYFLDKDVQRLRTEFPSLDGAD